MEHHTADTLGDTDHALLLTHLPIRTSPPPAHRKGHQRTLYKWVPGTSTQDYALSSHKWETHTSSPEFLERFSHIVHLHEDVTPSPAEDAAGALRYNTLRAQAVEQFLLDEAEAAGVVTKTTVTRAANPNKWDKALAPWFTDDCRHARRAFFTLRRRLGRRDPATIEAWRTYKATCARSKLAFQSELPAMLKYRPKQFWGMLKRKAQGHQPAPDAFAAFN